MNAIIALCHFCELHGPSVLFCTQSFHDSDNPQNVLEVGANLIKAKKKYYGKVDQFQKSADRLTAECISQGTGSVECNARRDGHNSDTCEVVSLTVTLRILSKFFN